MIDHIGVSVADYRRSRGFYESALAPLGYVVRRRLPATNPVVQPIKRHSDWSSK